MGVLETFNLDGKVALMTGGAGLFGRQIAEALAEAGATTIMASRNLEKLEEQAQIFRDRDLNVTAMQLDQGEPESIKALQKKITEEHGRIDVLVNNAVLRPMKGWADDVENFALSMKVNATGTFEMTRTFGIQMAEQGSGSIINVGSIQGHIGPDFSLYDGLGMDPPADYYFHKGGMLQLTRYAASKFGPSGVRVNTIDPGGFLYDQPEEFVRRYNQRTFLGRMANESDLKGVVVFLASDASVYITGADIAVDGGYTAK